MPRRAAIVEARRDFAVTPAVDADVAALIEQSSLRLHIDDASGAVTVSAGSAPVMSCTRLASSGSSLTEYRNTFRQDNAVQPVLKSVVLAADVQLAKEILRDAWCL